MRDVSGAGEGSGARWLALLVVLVGLVCAGALCASVGAADAETRTEQAVKKTVRGPDGILGKPRFGQAKATRYAKSKGATKYTLRAIPIYYELAPKVGIAPDVLIAQSMLETGYGKYGGDAKPWNMAGIKKGGIVGDEPEDFEQPSTARAGVRMHINHMAAYTNMKTLGKPHDRYYDARRAQESRGYWIRRVSQLGNGVWATDPEYSTKLKRILSEMSRA